MHDIGKRIRIVRKSKGVTQVELAEASGVSRSYLADLERGALQNPSLEILRAMSGALHVSVGELLGEDAANGGAGF